MPFINDNEENLRGILNYCFEAQVKGIICFGISLTLRDGNREYFYHKLDKHYPGLSSKYHRKYGYAYQIKSDNNNKLMKIFYTECKKHGVMYDVNAIFKFLNEFPEKKFTQFSLF